jgi:hypothetical protein
VARLLSLGSLSHIAVCPIWCPSSLSMITLVPFESLSWRTWDVEFRMHLMSCSSRSSATCRPCTSGPPSVCSWRVCVCARCFLFSCFVNSFHSD